MRKELTFLRNGETTSVADFTPDLTLLEYLRLVERKTGTKEGCNEGDCGACTVSLGRLRDGKLSYEPVNACILLLGQIDGCDLITVDDLADGEKLHPVQQAMVDVHASQCGFCTPGFVMSLFTMHHSVHRNGEAVTRKSINDWVAGNLCRCTGYRPIADAALQSVSSKPQDALMKRWDETEKRLLKLQDGKDVFVGDEVSFFAAPASIQSLADMASKYPDATIVSGATDVGLWINKQLRQLPKIIFVGRAKNFDQVKTNSKDVVLGAGARYVEAFDALAKIDPDIKEVLNRLGSRHVRASGTIGGNIANGSPIGDMPPMLIALGASIEMRHGKAIRTLALEDFFIQYAKQDRAAGELVTKIKIPKLKKHEYFRAFKISKRFDQDISAVLFAARFTVQNDRFVSVRIACGGMAGTPQRAKHAEAAISGAMLSKSETWERAIAAFEKDYKPLSDMRASADYRMKIVKNLMRKSLLEITAEVSGGDDAPMRVYGFREAAE
ncbi:MAG: xanthine dehydrogenase small subunit [Salaquimonas sp.]